MKRSFFGIVILALTCSLRASQTAAPYDAVLFAKDIMIAMRDGVKLATDIYRPSRNGTPVSDRLPILLQRTPYNKQSAGLVSNAKFFVQHGYVVAL
jgi:predicted acyl esterase